MQLDAHQHFWKYSAREYPWMQPDWPIRRDFLPPDLEPLLARAGLDGSIAVQARQSLEESRWLLELADRHPSVKGVVGWVDLRSEKVADQLAQFASHPKFVGVRHVVQDEPDDQFMLRPDFLRGIAHLKQFDLTYDILIYPKQLPAAIELVRRFPEQPFVLDHLAKPFIKDGTLSPWDKQIRELAKHPNVTCKISGLVTEAKWRGWQPADFHPYLDVAFDVLGEDRLMFGSDWPVALLSGDYDQVHGIVRDYLISASADTRKKIFGRNAARFYGLA
ncbi:MAG: amidohydrolase family protein [Verrucomicrobiota bacterium]